MEKSKNYLVENKKRILEELFGLLRIPSISSTIDHKKDILKAAEYWKKLLLDAGCDKAEIMPTDGNPVVYGEKIIGKQLPTVLVYGHYDVMPVDPIDLWNTPPFEPIIKDGKIWARGADDNKGQAFMHAKTFEAMIKTNTLPCNVKFMIEGEEEIGSPNMGTWCETNKNLLSADVILVSDTDMFARDIPSITTGLRGLAYWEVEVTGPNRDLHSGLFGGAVANPINVLSKMITDMVDENGHISIPGFYDDVLEVSTEERLKMAKAPFDEIAYKKELGVRALKGEKGYLPNEHTGIRPSFDVCGIWGGYTGEGAKTVLPSKAYAKISSRLVPNQDNEKIMQLFKMHFETIAPDYVSVNVKCLHGGQAYVCPINIPAYKAAEIAYNKVYKCIPIPIRSGGSIPIIATFEDKLGLKSLLMGFGLKSDAIHSPNENFPIEQLYNGMDTILEFYKAYAEVMK